MRVVYWLTFAVLLLFSVAYFFIGGIRSIFVEDTVSLYAKGLDRRLIMVKHVMEGSSDTTIWVSNGQILGKNVTQSGLNQFLVYYNNQLQESFYQFKRSSLASHDYVFNLHTVEQNIVVELEIFGPDQAY